MNEYNISIEIASTLALSLSGCKSAVRKAVINKNSLRYLVVNHHFLTTQKQPEGFYIY